MIFPIGDDQVKGGSYPIFSYAFIIINILVYFLLQLGNDTFTLGYSAIPYEVTHGVDLVDIDATIPQTPGPWPIYLVLITSVFMHGSLMHLAGNMVFLWIFADNIESTIGSRRFVGFYLLGGIVASLAHIATDINSLTPSLGASGAIAACLGAYIVMFPHSKIKVLVFLFFLRIPAFFFLGIWIVQQLVPGVGSLQGGDHAGVAWWAHIGGFAFGIIAGLFFKTTYPKVKLINGHYVAVKKRGRR